MLGVIGSGVSFRCYKLSLLIAKRFQNVTCLDLAGLCTYSRVQRSNPPILANTPPSMLSLAHNLIPPKLVGGGDGRDLPAGNFANTPPELSLAQNLIPPGGYTSLHSTVSIPFFSSQQPTLNYVIFHHDVIKK
jgi:hypothetical protein